MTPEPESDPIGPPIVLDSERTILAIMQARESIGEQLTHEELVDIPLMWLEPKYAEAIERRNRALRDSGGDLGHPAVVRLTVLITMLAKAIDERREMEFPPDVTRP